MQVATPFTTYAELNDDQRARFGDMVKTMDGIARAAAYSHEQGLRAAAALKATKGDTQAALALVLKGSV